MVKTKKASVGRRGFLKRAVALVATAQSALPHNVGLPRH